MHLGTAHTSNHNFAKPPLMTLQSTTLRLLGHIAPDQREVHQLSLAPANEHGARGRSIAILVHVVATPVHPVSRKLRLTKDIICRAAKDPRCWRATSGAIEGRVPVTTAAAARIWPSVAIVESVPVAVPLARAVVLGTMPILCTRRCTVEFAFAAKGPPSVRIACISIAITSVAMLALVATIMITVTICIVATLTPALALAIALVAPLMAIACIARPWRRALALRRFPLCALATGSIVTLRRAWARCA